VGIFLIECISEYVVHLHIKQSILFAGTLWHQVWLSVLPAVIIATHTHTLTTHTLCESISHILFVNAYAWNGIISMLSNNGAKIQICVSPRTGWNNTSSWNCAGKKERGEEGVNNSWPNLPGERDCLRELRRIRGQLLVLRWETYKFRLQAQLPHMFAQMLPRLFNFV